MAPVLEKVLQSHLSREVESAAVDALAAFDEPAGGKVILDHWREYRPLRAKTPSVRCWPRAIVFRCS